jgi:hypothetical protein
MEQLGGQPQVVKGRVLLIRNLIKVVQTGNYNFTRQATFIPLQYSWLPRQQSNLTIPENVLSCRAYNA